MSYQSPGYGAVATAPLGFGEALRLAWARKLDVSGRSRRSEYWWLALAVGLGVLASEIVLAVVVAIAAGIGHGVQDVVGVLVSLVVLVLYVALLVVSVTATVRRLHDTDRSGWWFLLSLVPLLGIVVLVFTLLDSTPGPNRYGDSPKVPAGAAGLGYPGAQQGYGGQYEAGYGPTR